LISNALKRLSLLPLGLCLAGAGFADVIDLTNGDRITGTVVSVGGGKVVTDTEYAGRIIIDLEAVARLETEAAFEVRLRDGSLKRGQFAPGEEEQGLLLEGGELAPVALAEVRTAGQSSLSLTRLGQEWNSRATLGAEITRGNSETDKYNLLFESTLKRQSVQHSVTLQVAEEEAEGVTTLDQLDLDYGYKRFISERRYASGNAEYFEDALKDVDSRITAGAGMGYQFWDNSFGALSSELGVSYVVEELQGQNEDNPAIRWGLDYTRNLWSQRLEFYYNHNILAIPVGGRGQISDLASGLRLAVNSWLDTSFRVDYRYETEPPPDTQEEDIIYSLGVGMKF